MVDAQFKDDQYVDVAERNNEAVREANERAANRAALQHTPKTKAEKLSDRAALIQAAGIKAEHGGQVVLSAFSKFTPNGEVISVKVKRLTPQELLAGDLLPISARKMVSHFVDLGVKSTQGERQRIGLDDISGEAVIEEIFDGDTLAAAEAYSGFIDAICIAAVKDPEIRLYWNEKAMNGDRFGLVVGVIPMADREKIANWALNAEEVAVQAVAPFLQRLAVPDEPLPTVEGRHGETERADSV